MMKKLFIIILLLLAPLPIVDVPKCFANGGTAAEAASKMTSENKAYFDKYLSSWSLMPIFTSDYNEKNFVLKDSPLYLFFSCSYMEGKEAESEKYFSPTAGYVIPAEVLEGVLTRHFPVSAQQLRAHQDFREYFDAEKKSYHFGGGLGGPGHVGVVTASRQEGNRLMLSCDWYDIDGARIILSHIVTIRLGKDKQDFYYMENIVTTGAVG